MNRNQNFIKSKKINRLNLKIDLSNLFAENKKNNLEVIDFEEAIIFWLDFFYVWNNFFAS